MTVINANGKSYNIPEILTANNGAGHSTIVEAGTGDLVPTLFAVMVDLVADAEAGSGGASASASAAAASASTATTQAGISTSQATTATTQAGIATSQATTATTQAGIATSQATTATTQAGIATSAAAGMGYSYTYSTTTTASNPGAGFLRFNNATVASATELYISETTANAQAISADLATWDDSTSTIKGKLKLSKQSNPAIFALFNITGLMTDNGAWDTFSITYITGSGSLTNADTLILSYIRVGDKGDTGGVTSVLSDIADVTISSPATNDFLVKSSGDWINKTSADAFNLLSPQTTKGDLITRNLSAAIRLGVGSNKDILTADSTAAGGLAWQGPATITYEFNVKSYGALGDNSTDDSAAIAAAVAALVSAGGGKLKFPCGIYKYNSPISITNVPIEIVGDGRDLSWLVYTGTGNGIVFNSTGAGSHPNNISGHGTPLKSLKVKGCTVAVGNLGNFGIYGTWADSTNNESLSSFEDVCVRNAYATTNYWTKAIYLINTNGTRFRDVFVSGDENAYATQTSTPWNCANGIHIHSTGLTSSASHYFSDMSGGNCDKYLNITGPCKLLHMTNCELVSVGYGIAAPDGGLNLHGTNVRIDFRLSSVVAVGWNNVQFVNSDFQRNGGLLAATIINGNVMNITTCEGFNLSDCRVRGLTSAGAGIGLVENGINLVGVTRGAISACRINDIADAGILIDSTSSNIAITGNVFSYCEYGIYNNSTTGILHANNVFNNIGTAKVFGLFSNGRRGAFMSRATAQSIPIGVDTPIDFTSVREDTEGFVTSGTRFTIPAGKGINEVRLSGECGIISNSTGFRALTIKKNGTGNYIGRGGILFGASPSGDAFLNVISAIIPVTAGDYFELAATHDSVSVLTTLGGREWFMIEVIS